MRSFVILSALLSLALAETSPPTLKQRSAQALHECVQEKSLNLKRIGGIIKNNILPQDNPDFTDLFLCYWKKLDVIKADGTLNQDVIKLLAPSLLKDKFPGIVDPDKIAGEALEYCKDIPQTNSAGLTGIKLRNCLMQYAQDHQP